MVRTMIQLTEQQSADLRELAAREGTSVAEMVRRAVDRILADAALPPKKSRLEALTVAGLFDSGSPGIARHHDDELAAAYLTGGSRPAQVG
jgi:hypothetical protein